MSEVLEALDRRFSIGSGPCVSRITGAVQLPSEHAPPSWTDQQRKHAAKNGKKPGPKPKVKRDKTTTPVKAVMTEEQRNCDHKWRGNGYNNQLKARRICKVCKWKEVID